MHFSHLLALVMFAALVSTVFATLLRNDRRSRLRFGLLAFGAFVLSAILVGWLMYPFPS
jgi:hypothetical protein